jgi:hypothetical protein
VPRPALVAPEYRPTLGDLLRPRIGARGLRALVALAALLAVAFVAYVLRPAGDGIDVVGRAAPVQYNLRFTAPLERISPRGGELLHLEARAGGRFVQSFALEPLAVAAHRGDVGGVLPVAAAREMGVLARRFPGFELVQDGKTRVNEVPGYQIAFRIGRGPGRRYGRVILLPQPVPGARRGVRILMITTPAGGVANATEVGIRGAVKRPYRTFRFGTEKP